MLFNYAYLFIVMQLLWLVALKFRPLKHLVKLWWPLVPREMMLWSYQMGKRDKDKMVVERGS
jgi:hypothetical protein